jgi:hypothetical protein
MKNFGFKEIFYNLCVLRSNVVRNEQLAGTLTLVLAILNLMDGPLCPSEARECAPAGPLC